MIRRPPRSTLSSSSAASDVYKRQGLRRGRGGEIRLFLLLRFMVKWGMGLTIPNYPLTILEKHAKEASKGYRQIISIYTRCTTLTGPHPGRKFGRQWNSW